MFAPGTLPGIQRENPRKLLHGLEGGRVEQSPRVPLYSSLRPHPQEERLLQRIIQNPIPAGRREPGPQLTPAFLPKEKTNKAMLNRGESIKDIDWEYGSQGRTRGQ